MPSAFATFGRTDLRGASRDALLSGLVLVPLVWIAMVRFGAPAVTELLAQRHQFDLTPYHPLVLAGFLLLTSPVVAAGVVALMVLDERDAGTLLALRVTPVPMAGYLRYRAAVTVALTSLLVLVTIPASGLFPPAKLPGLLVVAVLTGASGLVFVLVILALARNKVEGIAVIRGLGIVMAGLPLLPSFLDPGWGLLFAVLPTYWPTQAFLALSEGGAWWPYLLGGLAWNGLLCVPLLRRVQRG